MTDKQKSQVTDAGAVALEEGQLDQAQGGVIAIAPSDSSWKLSDGITQKVADGSVNKIAEAAVKLRKY